MSMESFGGESFEPMQPIARTIRTVETIPKGLEGWDEIRRNTALRVVDDAINRYVQEGRIHDNVFEGGEYVNFYKEMKAVLPVESFNHYLQIKGIHFSMEGLEKAEEKRPPLNLTGKLESDRKTYSTSVSLENVSKAKLKDDKTLPLF